MKGGIDTRCNGGRQAGFTIIELMIATLVFSIILITITAGILSFTRQYYRGVIASKTQDTARAIVDDVTRAIQFNTGDKSDLLVPIVSDSNGYCIGTSKRYSFALGRQLTDSGTLVGKQSHHALISDNISGCSPSTYALDVTSANFTGLTNPRELLGEHMRLAKFTIQSSSDFYTITVRVVYGDDDLLCSPNPSFANDCTDTNQSTHLDQPDLTCKLITGSQFCAASELSTTVKKRVN